MKKFLIITLLLLSTTAQAVTITHLPEKTPVEPSFISKILFLVKNCRLDFKCYFNPQEKLGATITKIWATTTIASYPTIHNDNMDALNNGKIENSTTSVASITTLSNLVSVGTLTSGALGSGFTTVVVERGGTGSTTLSANQVLLGSTTNAINVVSGWGTSGEALISNGGQLAPTWQSVSVNQNDAYVWTGPHSFTVPINASSSLAIATSSPPVNVNLAVNGGANITGTTTVGGLVATSSIDASKFVSTATSTFANGIGVTTGCFSDDTVCLMKAFSFGTSTATSYTTNLSMTITTTTGFQPTSMVGTCYMDSGTDVTVSFSWDFVTNAVAKTIHGTAGNTLVNGGTILCDTTSSGDAKITLDSTSATGFTLIYSTDGDGAMTAGTKLNMVVIGN